jgi:hypothetical protein
MKKQPPKHLLQSKYRRELWEGVGPIIRRIEKALTISEMHLMGSFNSKKKRPSDIDFAVLLKTPINKKRNWSVDLLVIAPDNKYGRAVLADNKKWVKQRYGKKSGHIKWK